MAFENLFKPGKIGSMELKNRIAMAPMGTRFHTSDGFVNQQLIDYYAARAQGGAGLINIEASYPTSYKLAYRLMINDEKYLPGMKKLVDAIHAGGAKVVLQMSPHQGRLDKENPLSASGKMGVLAGRAAQILSIAEIEKMVEEYGEGARRAKEVGFDGVMVHAAHGYLAQDFLSPLTNTRTDQYGGDLQKRAKFALDLVKVTRQQTGADYPVLCRLAGDERLEGGITVKDTIANAKLLQAAGVDAIDIVSAAIESNIWVTPSMYFPPAYNVYIAQAVKKEVSIPIMVAGKLKDPSVAEEILKGGKADFVTLGRALIADPAFPQKVKEGRTKDICACIGCLKCIQAIQANNPLVCAVNPAAGQEKELELKPAKKKKKVLVVGSGPAGMQGALTAARRGHDVTLWEKDKRLGGQVNLAVVPSGKEDIVPWLEYLIRQLEKAKVKVELAKEATPESILKLAPDAVIVATGGKPLTPKIKGLEARKGSFFTDVLAGKAKVKAKVNVLGGGYIGVETAIFLAEKGNDVTIIEILDDIAADAFRHIKTSLVQKLAEKKVKVFTGVKSEELVDKGLRITDKDGKEILLEANDLVIACGSVPNRDLLTALKGKVSELYEVGDCVKPRDILQATREGAAAALKI